MPRWLPALGVALLLVGAVAAIVGLFTTGWLVGYGVALGAAGIAAIMLAGLR